MSKIVIDTEAEITKLEKMLENLTDDKDKQSIRFAINLLRGCEKRPTGHWIKNCDSCDCSNCYDSGARFTRKDCSGRCSNCGELQCCTDNFCPNCGADMRGND